MKSVILIAIALSSRACTSDRRPEDHPTRLAPVLTRCGTSPAVAGNDVAMHVTTRANHCSITFATPFQRPPRFYAALIGTGGLTFTYSVTATGIELDGPAGTYEIAIPNLPHGDNE